MEAAVATFWIDSVSGAHESDFYGGGELTSKRINVNHWGSPKLTDQRTIIAFGKEEVKKLWREHWKWRELKVLNVS